MNPLETYLQELHSVRSYGVAVKETSYYGKLETLFNEVGKTLKPKVRCIINLRSQGAGIPDGGLFTPDQVLDDTNTQIENGPLPARGALEVKGSGENVHEIAQSEQVAKYLGRYGQVLVTNYRDFLLVRQDANGEPVELEEYKLAENEDDFWAATRHPHKVPGATSAAIRPELRNTAVISREGDGTLNSETDELALTVGWGHQCRAGVVMPGRGKAVGREYTRGERAGIEAGAAAQNLPMEEAFTRLGETTFDIYLNGVAYWRNLPANVWGYTIGGYQVIKKWLSYRERDVLGRPLTIDEVREVTGMARRIAAILLLEPQLDANYRAISEACYPWSSLDT